MTNICVASTFPRTSRQRVDSDFRPKKKEKKEKKEKKKERKKKEEDGEKGNAKSICMLCIRSRWIDIEK
jgi:ribosomal protein L12E/L44/L45/RPP1/RPP2